MRIRPRSTARLGGSTQYGAKPNSQSTARSGRRREQRQLSALTNARRARSSATSVSTFELLLDGGGIPHGEKVKDLLTQIETHSMRNVFAHSFLATDEHSVTFIHRKVKHGKYQATTYQISRDDFLDHVQNFVQLCFDFEQAVGLSHKEVADFAAMAVPLAPQDGS